MADQRYSRDLLRLQQEQQLAVHETNDKIRQWESFKSDYKALQERLKTLPDKMTHDVMVPFGSLAFMPGQLVHTNEILVLLGDNWFVDRSAKQASQIIDRRLITVEKQLEDLKKQRALLEPRLDFTSQLQDMTQNQGEMVDIREEYDSDKERQWKEEHRRKLRAPNKSTDRKKLVAKEERKTANKSSEQKNPRDTSDTELWARLDELEAIETKNRELERLTEDDATRSPLLHWSDQKYLGVEGALESADEEDEEEESSYSESGELDSDDDDADEEGSDQPLRTAQQPHRVIHFSHSEVVDQRAAEGQSISTDGSHPIETPADLYRLVEHNTGPKSILKPPFQTSSRQKEKRKKRRDREVTFAAEKHVNKSRAEKTIVSMKADPGSSGVLACSDVVVEKSSSVREQSSGLNISELPKVDLSKTMSKFKARSAVQRAGVVSQTSEVPVQSKPVSKFKSQRSKQGIT